MTIGGIAFDALTNNTITALAPALWTPDPGVNGTGINAFTVVALDDQGVESATPVQVSIDVGAVNETPVIQGSDVFDAFGDDDLATNTNGIGAGFSTVTNEVCLLYTSPSPRDLSTSRMPSSA